MRIFIEVFFTLALMIAIIIAVGSAVVGNWPMAAFFIGAACFIYLTCLTH